MAQNNDVTLYECAQMFAETMKEKFGPEHDGCIFLVTSNGKQMTQLISGDDKLLTQTLANVLLDEEIFGLTTEAMRALLKAEAKARE